MGIFSDTRTRVMAGLAAYNTVPAVALPEALDKIVDMDDEVNKALQQGDSHLKLRSAATDYTSTLMSLRGALDQTFEYSNAMFGNTGDWGDDSNVPLHKRGLPSPHDPRRDFVTGTFWKNEPLLAGAVYSMSAKMTALSWRVTGTKATSVEAARMFARALSNDGPDWSPFIGGSAIDFFTTNRGVFWDVVRNGNDLLAPMTDIGHIDALCCGITGNTRWPMLYQSSVTGQIRKFRSHDYIHFASMASPREDLFGTGTCAVSRVFRSSRIMLGLHDYDAEKLSNLPPEGVAAVSGLTADEFRDSLAIWRAERKSNSSLTYPQVLWLLSGVPNSTVDVNFSGFSQIPESFDRKAMVEYYVNLLALVFGVDAREFWPISSSSMGTASESEIQHMKAKGKGPGEFVTLVERKLNAELPEAATFGFDTRDIGEDQAAAATAKAWIDALMPLLGGGSGKNTGGGPGVPGKPPSTVEGLETTVPGPEPKPSPEQLISKDDFLRMLADRDVLPEWVVGGERVTVTDIGIVTKNLPDHTPLVVDYDGRTGLLSVSKPPAYEIMLPADRSDDGGIIKAIPLEKEAGDDLDGLEDDRAVASDVDILKQLADEVLEENRGIRGKPLPAREALRGPLPTEKTVAAELERWKSHKILSKYLPGDATAADIAAVIKNVRERGDAN